MLLGPLHLGASGEGRTQRVPDVTGDGRVLLSAWWAPHLWWLAGRDMKTLTKSSFRRCFYDPTWASRGYSHAISQEMNDFLLCTGERCVVCLFVGGCHP